MADEPLQWFSGSGGPLVLLPEELLESWEGVDNPKGGRNVDTKTSSTPGAPCTDFDRACDIEEPMANLDVGAGRGVVLTGDPLPTTFLRLRTGGLLIRCEDGELSESQVAELREWTFESDSVSVALIEARPGPILLFDAACPGYEVEEQDRLILDLHPGQYMASFLSVTTESSLTLDVVYLERVG
jgi:hypothetical protein